MIDIENPYLRDVENVLVYDSSTQEGDPEALRSLQKSVKRVASRLLDPKITHDRNLSKLARKAYIWSCDPTSKDPNPFLISEVFAGAGLETGIWIVK